jgi:hypothetical protein
MPCAREIFEMICDGSLHLRGHPAPEQGRCPLAGRWGVVPVRHPAHNPQRGLPRDLLVRQQKKISTRRSPKWSTGERVYKKKVARRPAWKDSHRAVVGHPPRHIARAREMIGKPPDRLRTTEGLGLSVAWRCAPVAAV